MAAEEQIGVEFSADSEELQSALQELQNQLSELAGSLGQAEPQLEGVANASESAADGFNDMSDAASGSAGEMDNVEQGMGSVTEAAGLLAGAVAAAFSVSAIVSFANEIDNLAKLGKRVDLPSDEMQRLNLVAQTAGTNINMLARQVVNMNARLRDTESTGERARQALARMGVEVDTFLTLSAGDQIVAIGDAFQSMGDHQEASAALLEVMSTRAQELIPLFREGGAAIQETMARANVLTQAQTAEIERLNDEWAIATNNIKTGLMSEILPALTSVQQALSETGESTQTLIKLVGVGLVGSLVAKKAAALAGVSSLKGLTTASLAFIATPIGATITAIAVALNEARRASDRWSESMVRALEAGNRLQNIRVDGTDMGDMLTGIASPQELENQIEEMRKVRQRMIEQGRHEIESAQASGGRRAGDIARQEWQAQLAIIDQNIDRLRNMTDEEMRGNAAREEAVRLENERADALERVADQFASAFEGVQSRIDAVNDKITQAAFDALSPQEQMNNLLEREKALREELLGLVGDEELANRMSMQELANFINARREAGRGTADDLSILERIGDAVELRFDIDSLREELGDAAEEAGGGFLGGFLRIAGTMRDVFTDAFDEVTNEAEESLRSISDSAMEVSDLRRIGGAMGEMPNILQGLDDASSRQDKVPGKLDVTNRILDEIKRKMDSGESLFVRRN